MTRAVVVDSPAEEAGKESPKFRLPFKLPSWQATKKVGARIWAFMWKWFRWPVLAVVGAIAAYYVIPLVVWLIGQVLGILVQLIFAVIAIPALCLWAVISHPFRGADMTVSYTYWPFSERSFDLWNWGAWTLNGIAVYVLGGLTGLLLAYVVSRPIRGFLTSRAQEKKRSAAAAQRAAESKEQSALAAKYDEGRAAGIAEERATVRKAFIHAYKPKMTLPAVPEGRTRVFWINARLKGQDILPTKDRAVHWADIIGEVPEFAIGAPAYRRVISNECDSLAMMTVVFTLNAQPSDW